MKSHSRRGATVWCAAILLALAACASQAPRITSDAAAGVDLAQYRSFDFLDPLSTDRSGYSTLTTQQLKAAAVRELTARGLRETAVQPDLLVNFTVTTRETLASGGSPRVGVSYGGWSGGHGMGIGVSTGGGARSVTEGTLTIDLVDRARNQLVWTGSASGRLPRDASSRSQSIIDSAVHSILERYPVHHAMP